MDVWLHLPLVWELVQPAPIWFTITSKVLGEYPCAQWPYEACVYTPVLSRLDALLFVLFKTEILWDLTCVVLSLLVSNCMHLLLPPLVSSPRSLTVVAILTLISFLASLLFTVLALSRVLAMIVDLVDILHFAWISPACSLEAEWTMAFSACSLLGAIAVCLMSSTNCLCLTSVR